MITINESDIIRIWETWRFPPAGCKAKFSGNWRSNDIIVDVQHGFRQGHVAQICKQAAVMETIGIFHICGGVANIKMSNNK